MPDLDEDLDGPEDAPVARPGQTATIDDASEAEARLERALERIAAAAQTGRSASRIPPEPTVRLVAGQLDSLIGRLRATLGEA